MAIKLPPEYVGLPFIGKDISWNMIEKGFCRVKHFTPFAKVEGGKVKAFGRATPYALLNVESPKLPKEAVMPVCHRLDFLNLWDIFQQRGVGQEEEVLVSYVQFFENWTYHSLVAKLLNPIMRLFNPIMPKLHFLI